MSLTHLHMDFQYGNPAPQGEDHGRYAIVSLLAAGEFAYRRFGVRISQ